MQEASERWFLTAHILTEISENLEHMCGIVSQEKTSNKEEGTKKITKYDEYHTEDNGTHI